jgi:hypothetical protein
MTASQASAPFFVAPSPPGHLGRRRLRRNERVGEAGAVHMHADPVLVSNRTELGDFAHAVDRPRFRSLGQRQRARLRRFNEPARKSPKRLLEALGGDLASLPGDPNQLGAAGEELRRAAFIVVDVRFLVTEHRIPGLDQRRKRERVRRRARRHQEGGDLGLEHVAQARSGLRGIVVSAIGGRIDAR